MESQNVKENKQSPGMPDFKKFLVDGIKELDGAKTARGIVPLFLNLEKDVFTYPLNDKTDDIVREKKEEIVCAALAAWGGFIVAIVNEFDKNTMSSLTLSHKWNLMDKTRGIIEVDIRPDNGMHGSNILTVEETKKTTGQKKVPDGAMEFLIKTLFDVLAKTEPEKELKNMLGQTQEQLNSVSTVSAARILGYFQAACSYLMHMVFEYKRLDGIDYADMFPDFKQSMVMVKGASGKSYVLNIKNEQRIVEPSINL